VGDSAIICNAMIFFATSNAIIFFLRIHTVVVISFINFIIIPREIAGVTTECPTKVVVVVVIVMISGFSTFYDIKI